MSILRHLSRVMLSGIGSTLLLAAAPDPKCLLIPDPGPCKGLFTKYYYDAPANQCRSFTYGGCQGVVPFDTMEECRDTCVTIEETEPIDRKPAIYLYPTRTTDIRVTLAPKGVIIASEPSYRNGWRVRVESDGSIEGGYGYLFYEVKLPAVEIPQEGWVVETARLSEWFDEYLPRLGLNEKESSEFKKYWLPLLGSASPYYRISLLSQSFLEENMALAIDPKPDTLIRINFRFEPLREDATIIRPEIGTPERKGFVAVEWGGVLAEPR